MKLRREPLGAEIMEISLAVASEYSASFMASVIIGLVNRPEERICEGKGGHCVG